MIQSGKGSRLRGKPRLSERSEESPCIRTAFNDEIDSLYIIAFGNDNVHDDENLIPPKSGRTTRLFYQSAFRIWVARPNLLGCVPLPHLIQP